MSGLQNPLLRGMLANQASQERSAANQIGLLGNVMALQNQAQMQPLQLQQLQQSIEGRNQQQQALAQFAQSLPPQEQVLFQADPKAFMAERNKRYSVGGNLVTGAGQKVYESPPEMKIGPAGQVYNPRELQPGQVMADPNRPFQIGPGGSPIPNAAYQQYEKEKAAAGRSITNVNVKERQRNFENEDKLRADYSSDPTVKASSEMQNAFNLIEAAYQRPSAANDLAMATKYMKILDPTSVVRESEFALAVNATGLLDKVQNYAASVLEGKKLNPNQRKDFYESAKAINDAFQKQKGAVDSDFSEMTSGYGLNPKNVIPSLRRRASDKPEGGVDRRAPAGVDPKVWAAMTPEEKALWR